MRPLSQGLLLISLALTLLASVAWGELEDEVRRIAAQLRCPVCQNLSVADSPGELANQMRDVIREKLAQGEGEEHIKAYFVSKYGEWVLLAPTKRGLNLLVWILPGLALVGGGAGVVVTLRRWRARATAEMPVLSAADSRYRAQLAQELEAMDRAEEVLDRPRSAGEGPAHEVSQELQAERAALYGGIKEIELDYHAGKLSGDDYHALRQRDEARGVELLKRLAAGQGRQPQARGATETRAPRQRPHRPAAAEAGAVEAGAVGAGSGRPLRLAVGGIFLVGFGLALGFLLAGSLRPRMEGDGITGDFLTGTSSPQGMPGMPGMAGGVMPGGAAAPEAGPKRPLSPQMLAGMLQAAHVSLDQGRYAEAMTAYRAVLDRDPQNVDALTHLGVILQIGGHTEGALLAFDSALAIDPQYLHALHNKGAVLYELKQDYAGAIQAWEAFLARVPSGADAERIRSRIQDARTRLVQGRNTPSSPER